MKGAWARTIDILVSLSNDARKAQRLYTHCQARCKCVGYTASTKEQQASTSTTLNLTGALPISVLRDFIFAES